MALLSILASSGETTAVPDDSNLPESSLPSSPSNRIQLDDIQGLQEEGSESNIDDASVFDEDEVSDVSISDQKLSECRPLDSTPISKVSDNVLHNYSSYTYNISLHALSPDIYNSIMDGNEYIPKHVLIASAGRRDPDTFARDTLFKDDFYFDKLSMTTIVGMTSRSKNSNVINLDFTVIEPYGMTLINKLIALGEVVGVEGNHLKIPYLLQIDFFGYDNEGTPQKIQNITKTIPIQITTLTIKISNKGAEYAITAVPFNHQAFSETIATVPFKLEVTAGNIDQFFKDDSNEAETSKQLQDAKAVQESRIKESREMDRVLREKIEELDRLETALTKNTKEGKKVSDEDTRKVATLKKDIEEKRKAFKTTKANWVSSPISAKVESFTQAVNSWKKDIAAENNDTNTDPDRIAFYFETERMALAGFPDQNNIQVESMSYSKKGETQDSTKTSIALGGGAKTLSVMSVNAGQSVLDVLSKAMLNSSYVLDQILDTNKTKITKETLKEFIEKPLKWYRAIPRIKLGKYNSKTGEFQKSVTYLVVEYEVGNCKTHEAHMAPPKQYVKKYGYIFKGTNNDIIDFDIKFDVLYFTSRTANPAAVDVASQANNRIGSEDEPPLTPEGIRAMINQLLTDKVRGHVSMRHREFITAEAPGDGFQVSSRADAAKNLQNNLLSGASGDMISVTLKIIGDPDFIKQDDMFYMPGDKHALYDHKTPNGSIITDDGSVYVMLEFNVGGDYHATPDDAKTGLITPDRGGTNDDNRSAFSGLYQVISVKNTFANGKFEQELELVRHPYQSTPGMQIRNVQTQSTGRADEYENVGYSVDDAGETYSIQKAAGVRQANPTLMPNLSPPTLIPASASQLTNDVLIGNTGSLSNIVNSVSQVPFKELKNVTPTVIDSSSNDGTIDV